MRDCKTELDSISALTHWVADNIRYAGISMGEGEGFTLHNQEMNFTDRCGVCKDKASTLIGFLRAAGFKAYAAMTMAGERIDRIPADQFNHSVCAVQLRNGQFLMLDPTWVPGVRELWSSAEQQQGYLIGTAEGCDLMETPVSPAEKHYLRILGETAIDMQGTLTAEGQSDASVRNVFRASQSEWRASLERQLLAIAPEAEITDIQHTDPNRYLDQPVSITYRFRIPHYATVDKEVISFIPLGTQFLQLRHEPPLLQPQRRDTHPALQRPLLEAHRHPRDHHPPLCALAVPLSHGRRHRQPRRQLRMRFPDGRQQALLRRAGGLRQARL